MRTFGHQRHERHPETGEILFSFESPAQAVTRESLGGQFGADRRRKLIVSLNAGDLVTFRPSGTRRPVQMKAVDLYRYCLRVRAQVAVLEKARAAKARRAQRLADQRAARHSAKLSRASQNHQPTT